MYLFDWKCSFWVSLVQIFKYWNLVTRLFSKIWCLINVPVVYLQRFEANGLSCLLFKQQLPTLSSFLQLMDSFTGLRLQRKWFLYIRFYQDSFHKNKHYWGNWGKNLTCWGKYFWKTRVFFELFSFIICYSMFFGKDGDFLMVILSSLFVDAPIKLRRHYLLMGIQLNWIQT